MQVDDGVPGAPHVDDGDRVLVLVVEPDPYSRTLQRELLAARYAVELVEDGEAALASIRRTRPLLLIAEILVPKLDGLRLCRMLKEDPATRDVSVLIFSELLAERRAREAGADAFLLKPIDERRFLAEVQRLLSEATLRRTSR